MRCSRIGVRAAMVAGLVLTLGLGPAPLARAGVSADAPGRACERSYVRWLTFSDPARPDRLTVRATGPSCARASIVVTLRDASRRVIWRERTHLAQVESGRLPGEAAADDVTFNGPRLIRVLVKPAAQIIQDAIAAQFIAALPDTEARANCKVRPFSNPAVKTKAKPLFTIMPTGAYARKIDKKLKEEPGDFGCGEFGGGQSIAYFEYHPAETKTRFLWVDTGQDEPLYDQDSIEVIGE